MELPICIRRESTLIFEPNGFASIDGKSSAQYKFVLAKGTYVIQLEGNLGLALHTEDLPVTYTGTNLIGVVPDVSGVSRYYYTGSITINVTGSFSEIKCSTIQKNANTIPPPLGASIVILGPLFSPAPSSVKFAFSEDCKQYIDTKRVKSQGLVFGSSDCEVVISSTRGKGKAKTRCNATMLHDMLNTDKVVRIKASSNTKAAASVDIGVSNSDEFNQNFGAYQNSLFGAATFLGSQNKFYGTRMLSSSNLRTYNQDYNPPSIDTFLAAADGNSWIVDGLDYRGSIGNAKIRAGINSTNIFGSARLRGVGSFKKIGVDKYHGYFDEAREIREIRYTRKQRPIDDIITSKNNVYFVNSLGGTENLYDNVNEGVYLRDFINSIGERNASKLVCDDDGSYIQPSSIFAEGDFTYKCRISRPTVTPEKTILLIRGCFPHETDFSEIPPVYKLHNIRYEDPSGNLIVKYKDITLRGDGEPGKEGLYANFETIITEPEINFASQYTWENDYPILDENSIYTLNIDFSVQCFYKPFSKGFNLGYEDKCHTDYVDSDDRFDSNYLAIDGTPLSTRSDSYRLRPDNTFRISGIEIQSKGNRSHPSSNRIRRYRWDNKLDIFTSVQEKGSRVERDIYPTRVLPHDYENGIYPSVESVWRSSPDINGIVYENTTASGLAGVNSLFTDIRMFSDITLMSTSPIADSGKLRLLYQHKRPISVKQPTGGAFNFGSKNRKNTFDSAKVEYVYGPDVFFTVDEIELHVKAKKAQGSRDFSLDVVGYSDDGILNITSQVGGFLQTPSGVGILPTYSGFYSNDHLGIASEPNSSKEQYYSSNLPINAGGDHYLLSNYPVINSTEFKDYVIPLKVYDKIHELGRDTKFNTANYFENLYLDIFPIPSGASIAKAKLVVKYKPSHAISLHTIGQAGDTSLARRRHKLYVSGPKEVNSLTNVIPSNGQLSLIEDIPHGYSTKDTLKTNYSKRWRGVDGNVKEGPFNAIEFSFAYSNPEMHKPFLYGYYDFSNSEGNSVYSDKTDNTITSGLFSSDLQSSLIQNLGMRFNSNRLFASQDLPYRTIDWTQSGSELYGKITDSFNYAVRSSGADGYINFGDVHVASGFSVFARFSPDDSISGVNYNLFESGVIVSKWDSGKDLEFAIGYDSGKITGYARDIHGNIIKISDNTNYDEYVYPVPVLLTYNDSDSRKLRLYVDNELNGSGLLRASSDPFVLHSGDSDLLFGYSDASGVGINAFFTDIGISAVSKNIFPQNPNNMGNIISDKDSINSVLQQTSADSFFSSFRAHYKNGNSLEPRTTDDSGLWNFVNEDTEQWYLGAFKYCEFFRDYDVMKNRVGKDFINHKFSNNNVSYDDITDLTLPSSVAVSGLAYHSQIENDSIRFHLSDVSPEFHSVAPRIAKSFSRGYKFSDDAIVIDTIVQHTSTNDITWPDGSIGPRLIVSLYTPFNETELFETNNWGLINRSIHHLNPLDCWNKISTTFNLSDVLEKRESWSEYVKERNKLEMDHHYYADQINRAFVQYDLAYPSGQYDSEIKIHSTHVRLEDVFHVEREIYNSDLWLSTSGDTQVPSTLSLCVGESHAHVSSGISIYTSGNLMPIGSGELFLYTSGVYFDTNYLPMFVEDKGYGNEFLELHTIGIDSWLSNVNNRNRFSAFGDGFSETGFVLYTSGRKLQGQFGESISLYTANSYNQDYDNIMLFLRGNFEDDGTLIGTERHEVFNLFTTATWNQPIENETLNLYVDAYDPLNIPEQETMNLVCWNESQVVGGLESFIWNSHNVGIAIDVLDNNLLLIDADDEIRGVQTVCYGDCTSGLGCNELQLETHNTVWFEESCVQGGVLRPFSVYTNPNVLGYNVVLSGYKDNFYGVRKFKGLVPGATYDILVNVQTGTSGILEVPRQINEWEYGTVKTKENALTSYPAPTGEKEGKSALKEDIDYTGSKLTVPESIRHTNDYFGYSSDLKGDMLVIGAPHYDLSDDEGALPDAGSLFVFRRNPAPSGHDWSNQKDKSDWVFDTQITLPDAYLRDYYTTSEYTFVDSKDRPIDLGGQSGTTRQWFVGQEGRNLGHDVKLYKNGDKELIFASGPNAKWTRRFPDLVTNPVNVVLFIFTDEFLPCFPFPRNPRRPSAVDYQYIQKAFLNKDILFKYFCDPPVSFNIEIVIVEGIAGTDIEASPNFEDDIIPPPNFIHKRQIHRHEGFVRRDTQEFRDVDDQIFAELKAIYDELYPIDNTKILNNIPAIFGFYVDDSASYGPRALGSSSNSIIKDGALYRFQEWIKQKASDNNFVDIYNDPAQPHMYTNISEDEGWIFQSSRILDETLNIEALYEKQAYRLFANNLGTFNENISDFNYPPASGGAVYIFEKDAQGEWFPLQEINSPTTSSDTPPDRFGYTIEVSDDGKVLAVGSPFMNPSVQVYRQRSEEDINIHIRSTLIEWITTRGISDTSFGEAFDLYDEWRQFSQSGYNIVQYNDKLTSLYNKMSARLKYEFRKENNIREFELFSSFNSKDNSCPWYWLSERFLPNERMGYSLALNSDGTKLAVGCPTDSIGAKDIGTFWFKPGPGYAHGPLSWKSNVNAGSVRIYESRSYYPHNKVVNYGKFGNLYELTNKNDSNEHLFEEYMSGVYTLDNKTFVSTDFTETEIPEDAGLMFIITPAVDAASDEVIDNIQKWLALGDRNLVLIGNDPIWENDRLYESSNSIINYILSKLDTKMKIHPARNKYESLVNLETGTQLNVGESFVPEKTTTTYIYSSVNLRGSGVGDIRIEDEGLFNYYVCEKPPSDILSGLDTDARKMTYTELHDRCNMPIIHEGDLRAEWKDQCVTDRGGFVTYKVNPAFVYGTHSVCDWRCSCDNPTEPTNIEPIPILSAREKVTKVIHYEEIPPDYITVGEVIGYQPARITYKFAEQSNSGLQFLWSESESDYSDLTLDYNNTNHRGFYNPPSYFGRDAVLQNSSSLRFSPVDETYLFSYRFDVAAEQEYKSTGSRVSLISSTALESFSVVNAGDDRNIYFFAHLTDETKYGEAVIGQLGGWTQRTTFKAGNQNSALAGLFSRLGNKVYENVDPNELDREIDYDVIWISNTDVTPNSEQINQLKNWLNKKTGRKLVITYGTNPDDINDETFRLRAANVATTICEALELDIKPMFLPGKNRFATHLDCNDVTQDTFNNLEVNVRYLPISIGFRNKLIEIFSIPNNIPTDNIIPIHVTGNSTRLLSVPSPVYDIKNVEKGVAYMRSNTAKVSFPVVAGSGYRVFFNKVRESNFETEPLKITLGNCTIDLSEYDRDNPQNTTTLSSMSLADFDLQDKRFDFGIGPGVGVDNLKENLPGVGRPETIYQDVFIPSGVENIDIYFSCYVFRNELIDNPTNFRSERLVAVSGSTINIEFDESRRRPIIKYTVVPSGGSPATSVTTEYNREISTSSSKYCPTSYCENLWGNPGPDIADGPVVVAQQVYHQKPFDAGVNKSRITVISDPSLIQGDSIIDPEDTSRINQHVRWFLSSLYPITIFPWEDEASTDLGFGDLAGQQYTSFTKIVSPEKVSPARLLSADSSNSGINSMFGSYATIPNNKHSNFGDSDFFYEADSMKGYLLPWIGKSPYYTTYRDPAIPFTEEQIQQMIQSWIQSFESAMQSIGCYSKFKVNYNGKTYEDSFGASVSDMLKEVGFDFLDFDRLPPSGYPGDLFGYAVEFDGEDLLVSSPFTPYSGTNIVPWSQVVSNSDSGPLPSSDIGHYGGAGAVYLFEKGGTPIGPSVTSNNWVCVSKIRPEHIKSGSGIIDYGDQFGRSIASSYDVLAISAPRHNYESFLQKNYSDFLNKEFNEQFSIGNNVIYDLANPSNNEYASSGITVLNRGAVYTYEKKFDNWVTKTRSWVPLQKLTPVGYMSESGVNDYYGLSISLDRARRTDADYTLVATSCMHEYGSGINTIQMSGVGGAFLNDAMLRKLRPAYSHPDTYIAARLFGNMNTPLPEDRYMSFLRKNGTEYDKSFYYTGEVEASLDGEIFIEISGQDKISKGYTIHRPFIKEIRGAYKHGKLLTGYNDLFVEGAAPQSNGEMILVQGQNPYGNVYNTTDLVTNGVLGVCYPYGGMSGIQLFTSGGTMPIAANSGVSGLEPLFLYLASGVDTFGSGIDLYVRGYDANPEF